ncbi:DUF3048 domain-containing protein [Candidatus Parcubacteria bacterium]|jgi:hypothetical protein|nr:DUF3048 domain-containing protein [Candidatus Parcubacteria bacterium]MBT3949323.1 DUF3048 domain-containing protein [Candidatus Parcubacteria bacterium]
MKKIVLGYISKIKEKNSRDRSGPVFNEIKFLYILSGIIFIAAIILIGFFGWGYLGGESPEGVGRDRPVPDVVEEDCEHRRTLDGICVEFEKDVNPKLVAVMVENHTDARPQSGLSQARVVYEAPVEANYSRFLLLYPLGDEVLKVGPVRSARPYYLRWLSEYKDTMYMHVGGSPEALDDIKEFDIFDLNEFYRGWYYWRSTDRYAPHNVYTSSKLWESAWEDYGPEEEIKDEIEENKKNTGIESWKFEEREQCTENCVGEFTVTFVPPTYVATWQFNSSTNKYERYQMGYPHLDKDGGLIEADTVIVQHVETEVLDGVGRLGMETIGRGDAVMFRDGYMIEMEWEKADREGKTRWFNFEHDDAVRVDEPLNPGKIWIEVLNQRAELISE